MKRLTVLLFLGFLGWSLTARAELTYQTAITGIAGNVLKNALARLKVEQDKLPHPLTPATVAILYKNDTKALQDALQPFGYFKPQITSHLVNQDSAWQANYQVNPGPLLKIVHVDVQVTGPGANNPKLQHFLKHFPLHQGQSLRTEAYQRAKQALQTLVEQQGYIKEQLIRHVILIDLKQYTASIALTLETGTRYYFGAIKFSSSPLSPVFLQRFVPFKRGQPYASNDLLVLQNNLQNSNYFQQVLVNPKLQKIDQYQIPIRVHLHTKKAQQYNLGLGYGTDTGPRGTAGWEKRYLTPTGHYFTSQLTASQIQTVAQAKYVIPGTNPLTDQYNINGSVSTLRSVQGNSHTQQVGIAAINTVDDWQRTLTLNYQLERYELADQPYQNAHFLLPSIAWQKIIADKPLAPNRGNRFNLTLKGTTQALFSNTAFAQADIQDKYIYRLTAASRVLLRTEIGYTLVHDLNELPLSQRFYAGGTQSIRGYNYQSLGPGRYSMIGSIEYQHRILGAWNWATFFDIGNAFNRFFAAGQPDQRYSQYLQQGAGIGLVWLSPVGPLELTAAKALTKAGQPMRIQFSMGADL